jgi:hypothetical protein
MLSYSDGAVTNLVYPIEVIPSKVAGGGGILYFPHGHRLDPEVAGEKYIVAFFLDDESPFLKAYAYYTDENGSSGYIELRGYTKRWAVNELMKKRSVWVTDYI